MTDDEINRMPWTADRMSEEEIQAWLASRKAAGAAIDIATCELGQWATDECDPYSCDPARRVGQISTDRFVRSPDSQGWVHESDLPATSVAAMYDRVVHAPSSKSGGGAA